jgi:hypothetical protein
VPPVLVGRGRAPGPDIPQELVHVSDSVIVGVTR